MTPSYLPCPNHQSLAGYDQISYKVILDAPDATSEQIDYLIERCEQSSPVGDTLERNVSMTLEFV